MRRWVMASVMAVMAVMAVIGTTASADAQVVAADQGETARRDVRDNPGVSSMVVMERPAFRVLRDFFEPGAVRVMHTHESAYHVITGITGTLRIEIEGAASVDVAPGEVLHLEGGVRHSIENIGAVPATIVEVFGKIDAG